MRESMFFLIFTQTPKATCEILKTKHKVLVRNKSDVIPNAIRVTLSNKDDMAVFISALKETEELLLQERP